MIVVSDTSPLNYLVLISQIDVLPQLFSEVYVPPSVLAELQHPRTPEVVKRWVQSSPDWLLMTRLGVPPAVEFDLDPGETEAISLALELGAEAILIDERKGRQIASLQGLRTLGTLTVLELAAEHGLLDLRSATDALRQTTFHIADHLIDAALQREATRRQTD